MSRRRNRYSQPTVSGYFNPEALDASQRLTSVSLDTVCENVEQIKSMIDKGQSDQAVTFWHRVFMPQINATRKQLNHTSYLERQQQQTQSSDTQLGSGSSGGHGSSRISPSQLPNDPRELRQLQDSIQRKINQSERSSGANAS